MQETKHSMSYYQCFSGFGGWVYLQCSGLVSAIEHGSYFFSAGVLGRVDSGTLLYSLDSCHTPAQIVFILSPKP